MYTKNSIKRLHSPAVDRAFDGLLPSSAHSNIPSLKLLQRYRTCALSKFTSDSTFFIYTCLLLSCVFDLFQWEEERRVKSTWQPLIAASVLFYNMRTKHNSFRITIRRAAFVRKFSETIQDWEAVQILNMPLFTVDTNCREELNYAAPTQPTPSPAPVRTHTQLHSTQCKERWYIGTHNKCYYAHKHTNLTVLSTKKRVVLWVNLHLDRGE